METTVINGMCRCCASEGAFKDIKRSYQWMGEEEVYGEMLKECFDIDLSATEDSDGSICEVCITQLRNACNFKKQVLQTEDHFKKQLQIKFFKPTVVKVEMQDENNQSDDNISLDDGFSGPEFDMPIKKEGTEDSKPKKRAAAAKASTSRAKKSKANDESADTSTTKRWGRGSGVIRIEKPSKLDLKLVTQKTRNEIRLHSMVVPESVKNKTNLRNILLHSNATAVRSKLSRGYGCAFCAEQFVSPADLKKHSLEEHDNNKLIKVMASRMLEHIVKLDITALICAICRTDLSTLDELLEHLKEKHDKTVYTDVKSQILPFKFETEELRCSVCTVQFSTFKLLQEHMSSHFPNYMCNICGAAFVTERLRSGHEKRHGNGEHKCDECDKTFSTPQKKRMHKMRTHLGFGKRNRCHFCDEKFMDYWKKMSHMVKEHGLPPVVLKCQACERTFNNQRALAYHTKKDHLLERKHKCTECDMSFFGIGRLKEHMTKHTGLRQFKCEICFKEYGRRHTLREHMRIHANDRRFVCAVCEQSFVQKCSWRSHMRSKHGEEV